MFPPSPRSAVKVTFNAYLSRNDRWCVSTTAISRVTWKTGKSKDKSGEKKENLSSDLLLFFYATREKSLAEERLRKVKVPDERTGINENNLSLSLSRVSLLRNSPLFFIRLRVKVENETGRKGRGYIVEVVTRNSSLRSRLRLGAPPVGCSFYDFTETFTSDALPLSSKFFFLLALHHPPFVFLLNVPEPRIYPRIYLRDRHHERRAIYLFIYLLDATLFYFRIERNSTVRSIPPVSYRWVKKA